MKDDPRRQWIGRIGPAAALGVLFACSGPPDSTWPGTGVVVSTQPPAQDPIISTVIDARPAAVVNGRIVGWGELRPLLSEAAGAEVLREVILDRMLAGAVAKAGITITANDLEAERELFYSTLSLDRDLAVRLARAVRQRQGLGRERLRRLLKRNASLRALVSGQVQVTDATIRQMSQIIHGPKRQARLIVLPTLAEAQAAVRRVEAGEFFGDLAVELSIDSSAPRGGLLEPISLAAPSDPEALRQTLWSLAKGDVSNPVLMERGYGVLMLLSEIPGQDVDMNEVRGEMERLARLQQQRILMDRLARKLLAEPSVIIIDQAIKSSW